MKNLIDNGAAWTVDQADGLRRMFARTGCVILPLVSNPHVKASGVAVERLTAVLALQGCKTLVVDAAETFSSNVHAVAAILGMVCQKAAAVSQQQRTHRKNPQRPAAAVEVIFGDLSLGLAGSARCNS